MENDFDIHDNLNKDKDFEKALRPSYFDSFNGQEKIVENLKVFVQAARMRGEALDHLLLFGPPGLGKTTLAGIIANELGVNFKVTSGPVLDKPGDLAGISLLRHGGLPHRYNDRQGSGCTFGATVTFSIHPCRGNDTFRYAYRSDESSFWY